MEGEKITIIGRYRNYNFDGNHKYIEMGDCEIIK
jgi:hypothetical protein